MKFARPDSSGAALVTAGKPSWAGQNEQHTRCPVTGTCRSTLEANALATSGTYAPVRHPQCVAFVLILLGFLLQWSTLLTLAMFPVLLIMYARLAITEEAEMRKRFRAEFQAYAARTPRFLPSWCPLVGADAKT